jgi:phenylalanine-4-hydroxylase
MESNMDLPSGTGSKNRFRDARRNPDFTIDQDWASYSAAEHDRWNRLFRRSLAALQTRGTLTYFNKDQHSRLLQAI